MLLYIRLLNVLWNSWQGVSFSHDQVGSGWVTGSKISVSGRVTGSKVPLFIARRHIQTSKSRVGVFRESTAVKRSFFNRVNRSDKFLKPCVNRILMHIVKYRDTALSCSKTAEPIEMQFRMLSRVGPLQGICIIHGM